MKPLRKFALLTVMLVPGGLSPAAMLYNLDFTPPEVGTYQTVFGNPTIQSSAGTLTNALIFHGVTGYDQIRLPIGGLSPHYDIHYDVLVHNLLSSQYAFTMLLDTPEVRTLDIHGGQNRISVFQPFAGGMVASSFLNDRVYHFDVSVDFPANVLSVALDSIPRYAQPINAASLQTIRFNMGPWVGGAVNAPTTYAALDNVVITSTPEPNAVILLLGAAAFFVQCRRTRKIGLRRG